jgi:eukaryotic-like serine/threonine-protein kinase
MAPIEKITTALQLPVGETEATIAPYRLGERILHIGMTSEGMLTR